MRRVRNCGEKSSQTLRPNRGSSNTKMQTGAPRCTLMTAASCTRTALSSNGTSFQVAQRQCRSGMCDTPVVLSGDVLASHDVEIAEWMFSASSTNQRVVVVESERITHPPFLGQHLCCCHAARFGQRQSCRKRHWGSRITRDGVWGRTLQCGGRVGWTCTRSCRTSSGSWSTVVSGHTLGSPAATASVSSWLSHLFLRAGKKPDWPRSPRVPFCGASISKLPYQGTHPTFFKSRHDYQLVSYLNVS